MKKTVFVLLVAGLCSLMANNVLAGHHRGASKAHYYGDGHSYHTYCGYTDCTNHSLCAQADCVYHNYCTVEGCIETSVHEHNGTTYCYHSVSNVKGCCRS